ncbi:MAG TPA: SemiSWEET family transporter [Candidatus Paceibacterota bacterium]|nr:MAG: hypothetical protein B7X03_03720 [Parcubacteria group bacterium 21-58-10]HQT82971.1 SemiSWEET family transporter [Candidatus Paceibacterota bacterium]
MLGFHHLRSRVIATSGREPFPARSAPKRLLDYVMYGVGVLAPLALLPQVIQIYTTKSAAGLSLSTWALLTFFNALWVLYGVVHRDKPIILTNILFTILNATIVVGVLLY